MKLKDYTDAQRRAWDEIAPLHKESEFERLLSGFKQPGFSCLDAIETPLLQAIGLKNKAVVQLACNNDVNYSRLKTWGQDVVSGSTFQGSLSLRQERSPKLARSIVNSNNLTFMKSLTVTMTNLISFISPLAFSVGCRTLVHSLTSLHVCSNPVARY